jgi:hypothetical protein
LNFEDKSSGLKLMASFLVNSTFSGTWRDHLGFLTASLGLPSLELSKNEKSLTSSAF